MCGIVGYIGKRQVLPILIKGLKRLEYRGYDSAGVAFFHQEEIKLQKSVGRIQELEKKLDYSLSSHIGIGHTRWATHGKVTIMNSHPHQVGKITIVHNGIIENYLTLKKELESKGYLFQTETDTEVACALIDWIKKNNSSLKMVDVLNETMKKLKGSYAIVVMVQDEQDKLYVMKKESPLVIGIGKEEYFIASDFSAYLDDTKDYIILEDNEIGVISVDNVSIYQNGILKDYVVKTLNEEVEIATKGEQEHYMMKEIKEQSNLIKKWNTLYFNQKEKLPDITSYQRIHIVACGTAYHAGLIGKYLFEKNTDFEVNVYVASEYRYQKNFLNKNTLVIAISQSGETADTLACVKMAKEKGATTLGIINVYNSSIARTVDAVIYTHAGCEVAVASTKAYTSQVYILGLLALEYQKKMEEKNTYQELPQKIEELIKFDYSSIINHLYLKKDIFYLGRNIDYVSMLEGSLKLKEITYIHSEAFPAGELKHGPISLIEEDTPVIALITHEETASKTISNIKEVKARGAYVVLIIEDGIVDSIDKNCYDEVIYLPKTDEYTCPILSIIPLQLIAYYTAKKKNLDIDKPRNLAKSVTVE